MRLSGVSRILAVAVTALIASWTAADAMTPAVLLAAAALAVAGLVVLASRHRAVSTSPSPPADARAFPEHTTLIRLRDPDAAGRPRPRAPSPSLTGAA